MLSDEKPATNKSKNFISHSQPVTQVEYLLASHQSLTIVNNLQSMVKSLINGTPSIDFKSRFKKVSRSSRELFNDVVYAGVSQLEIFAKNNKRVENCDNRPFYKPLFAFLVVELLPKINYEELKGGETLIVNHLKSRKPISIHPVYITSTVTQLYLLEKCFLTSGWPNLANNTYGDLNWLLTLDCEDDIHKIRKFLAFSLLNASSLTLTYDDLRILFTPFVQLAKNAGVKSIGQNGKSRPDLKTLRWFLDSKTPQLTPFLRVNLEPGSVDCISLKVDQQMIVDEEDEDTGSIQVKFNVEFIRNLKF